MAMSFAQKMGSDGEMLAKFAKAVGQDLPYFAHWSGEKRYGKVVENDGKVLKVEDVQSKKQYAYELVH